MFELLLLVAIAYAGARGVETVAGVDNRRYDTPEYRKTVATVAASGSQERLAEYRSSSTSEAPAVSAASSADCALTWKTGSAESRRSSAVSSIAAAFEEPE